MKPELRVTLEAMRDEFESGQLLVEIAPAPDPRHEQHCVRVVCGKNALWYRRFCAAFPSSRRRLKRLPDTAIRRRETARALTRLIAGEPAGLYGPRLLDAARIYWRQNAADLRARLAVEAAA
jgi:hypothetical protein